MHFSHTVYLKSTCFFWLWIILSFDLPKTNTKTKMKKLFLLLIIIQLGLGFSACKKETDPIVDPETPEGESPFEAPNVVDEATRKIISEIDTTNFTFTFTGETDMMKNLKVGSILVDSISDMAPDGYLRKVTAVTSKKGETVVETQQAFITDIAEKGSIRFNSGRVKHSQIKKIVLAEGVQWVGKKDPNFSVFSFDYNKTINGDYGEFIMEGHTSLDMEFFFNFDWEWVWELDWTLGHPEVELFESGVIIDQQASIHTEATGLITTDERYSLASFYFTPWTFMVGPVPVVFYPKLELFMEINGEISAEFTAGSSEEFHARMGAQYTSAHGWDEIAEHTYTSDFSAPNMSLEVNYLAHIGPEIGLYLYGIMGPYANVTACAQLISELEEVHGLWTMDFIVGSQAEVGARIDVLGFEEDFGPDPFCLFRDTVLHYDNEPFGNAIYIDEPAAGSQFAIGDNIHFKCSYTGNTPDAVKFFIGPDLIFEDTEAPYEYTLETDGLNEGRYEISVEEIMDGIAISKDTAEFFLRVLEWSEIDLSSYGIHAGTRCTDIRYLGSNDAWMTTSAAGEGKLLKTSDGGNTWQVVKESPLGLEQMEIYNNSGSGIFLTSTNKVYGYSSSSGDFSELEYGQFGQPTFQWKNVYEIATNPHGEIVAIGKDTGIPYEFEVYRASVTTNDPISEYNIPHKNEYGYNPKLYIRGNEALIYGIQDEDQPNKIFYLTSTDGGQSWEDHEFSGVSQTDILQDASILNENEWWIVGEDANGDALVLFTENAGTSWQSTVFDDIDGFSSVHFVDANKGYATINKITADAQAKVYQTNDGGLSWEPVFGISTIYGMEKVSFLGDELGVVVGQGPIIYKFGLN